MNTRTPMLDIENRLKKVFNSLDSKWVRTSFLLSKLDLSFLVLEQRQSKILVESLIKFYLWRKIKGLKKYPDALEKIQVNEEDALNLGFYKEDDKLLLPSKAWYNRFFQNNRDLTLTLNSIVEIILRLATQSQTVLDLEVVKEVIKKNGSNSNKGKAFKKAVHIVKDLVYPQIKIKIRYNAKFTTRDLLDILVEMAEKGDFCNNRTDVLRIMNEEDNVNRGKYPSEETMLYHFRKFKSVEQLRELSDKICDIMLTYAKKNYNILNRRKLDIAFDIHNMPFYGKKLNYLRGCKKESGTNYAFQFLTCSIVVGGQRFTLDVIPMHELDNLEDLVDASLKKVKSKIRINRVYLDRGFDRVSIINVLKKNNVKFLMPKIRTPTVKAWMDKSQDCKARIIKDFQIGHKEKAIANLVLVDDENGIKRGFITNLNIPVQLTHYLFRFYSWRWGIETGYRNMDQDFRPKTTSRNFLIRFFYFIFSTCLYNMWVLVNICVSIALFGRLSKEPIITAKMFTEILYRVQSDSGG